MRNVKVYPKLIPEAVKDDIQDLVLKTIRHSGLNMYMRDLRRRVFFLQHDLEKAKRRIAILEKQIDGKVDKARPS